jgi:hypothetical protein
MVERDAHMHSGMAPFFQYGAGNIPGRRTAPYPSRQTWSGWTRNVTRPPYRNGAAF